MNKLGYNDVMIQNYADFYFRNFSPPADAIKKVQEMRKKEGIHNKIHRYMECYA